MFMAFENAWKIFDLFINISEWIERMLKFIRMRAVKFGNNVTLIQ